MEGCPVARRIQFLVSALTTLSLALRKLGPFGTVRLLREKRAKQKRLTSALIAAAHRATLHSIARRDAIMLSPEATTAATDQADGMLADDNFCFSFFYHLKGIVDPWNYDPHEKKHWPKRQYEETRVHSEDTPLDVKIVWEINRFKDLPQLAIAAYLTHEDKYAIEVFARMRSWIEGNPFMGSVNWSSPLEVAIRLISWAATLRLLADAGFELVDERISRSIWEQVVFLNADLSTDKIVRSNHLVGETAGLYIVSSLFEFPEAKSFAERAKRILCDSVIEQTYADGVSREASGWYHGFVTDFVELVERTAAQVGDTLPNALTERSRLMKLYRNSVHSTEGGIVKYGDFDNGKPVELAGAWRDVVFGADPNATSDRKNYFPIAKHITAKYGKDYLFLRAGEFGWGGDGSSSHAHDDLLSPMVCLDGLPIIEMPGTYVYNGHPEERDRFRSAQLQNRIIIGGDTGAMMKPSFGWLKVGPSADIISFDETDHGCIVRSSYEDTASFYERICELSESSFKLSDVFRRPVAESVEWNFHFYPRWRLEADGPCAFMLSDYRDNRFRLELSHTGGELEVLRYEFSPSYMATTPAQALRLKLPGISSATTITFEITRSSE